MRYLSIAMLLCSAFALLALSVGSADVCQADGACDVASAQAAPVARCGDGPDGVCGYEAAGQLAVVDGAVLPPLTASELAFVPIATQTVTKSL